MTSIQFASLLLACRRGCRRALPVLALPALALLSAGPALADESVGTSAVADCFGAASLSTWFHPDASGTPSKIVVQEACGMPYEFFVLMHDNYGHVVGSPADFAFANGQQWLRVEPWSDGEYIEHVWILFDSAVSVRVWIAYEALDGSGNFVTDDRFSRNAPQLELSRNPGIFVTVDP